MARLNPLGGPANNHQRFKLGRLTKEISESGIGSAADVRIVREIGPIERPLVPQRGLASGTDREGGVGTGEQALAPRLLGDGGRGLCRGAGRANGADQTEDGDQKMQAWAGAAPAICGSWLDPSEASHGL